MYKLNLFHCYLLAIVLVSSACVQNKPNKKAIDIIKNPQKIIEVNKVDTAIYTYENLQVENTKRKDEQGNYDYTAIKYPVFKNLFHLNNYIEQTLYSLGHLTSKKLFKVFFNQHKKEFLEFNGGIENESFNATTLDFSITVLVNKTNLIVFKIYTEESGGAHPNVSIDYLNWNVETDKPINKDNIFIKGYQENLNAIAEKLFSQQNKQPLTDYLFEGGKFDLNNNFVITPKGLTFLYHQYELGPYGLGMPEVTIPYSSIKHLLRPNTVVSQYVK